MRASVIITSHNEGPDLEATVALVRASIPRPYEIIVVDDMSSIPVGFRLSQWEDVKVVRPENEQGGVAPSRNLGASYASGDTLVFLDSHMRMPSDWLKGIKTAVENYPNAIFCTACASFERKSRFLKSGAKFGRNSVSIGRTWLDRGPIDAIDRCPCILGACYIIPIRVWKALRGINPNFHGWGCTEQDLSLRAWMSGFEVRRINEVPVAHRFGRNLEGTFMNSWLVDYNRLVLCATLFEDGVFEERYWPFMKQLSHSKAIDRFNQQHDEILDFRTFVQETRRFSDVELHGLCDFRIPTIRDQQITVDQAIRDKAAKRELGRPKINVQIPFRIDKNLGRAYNETLEAADPNDWVLLLDHDVTLLDSDWYSMCQEVVENVDSNVGMLTCTTNRIASAIQKVKDPPQTDDLKCHRIYATEIKKDYGTRVIDVTDEDSGYGTGLCGGFFMLVRRKAWHAAGGFPDGLYVDYQFCDRLRKHGWRIGLIAGIYVYHARVRDNGAKPNDKRSENEIRENDPSTDRTSSLVLQ